MARINDRLLVQLVDPDLVILDRSGGQEIKVPYEDITRFLAACQYLHRHASCYDQAQVIEEVRQIWEAEQRVEDQLGRG